MHKRWPNRSVTFFDHVEEIRKAFRDSVDDYLDFCAERGEKPDKPFSGKFILRMNPELHRQAYSRAREMGVSLNEWVNRAVEKQLSLPPK